MILLDTNVVSELRKAATRRVDPAVRAWANTMSSDTFYLSAISVLEIRKGILQKARTDDRQASALDKWLNDLVLPAFAGRILPVDVNVAWSCASLHVPTTRPQFDSLIAATALAHDLPLATRNTRDFVSTGVRLVDPWAYRVGTGSSPE